MFSLSLQHFNSVDAARKDTRQHWTWQLKSDTSAKILQWFTCGAWIRIVSTDTSLTQAPQVKHNSCYCTSAVRKDIRNCRMHSTNSSSVHAARKCIQWEGCVAIYRLQHFNSVDAARKDTRQHWISLWAHNSTGFCTPVLKVLQGDQLHQPDFDCQGWNTFVIQPWQLKSDTSAKILQWVTCGAWIRKVSTDTSLTQASQVKHNSCYSNHCGRKLWMPC